MAKVTTTFPGKIEDFVKKMDYAIETGSVSATIEAAEHTKIGECDIYVRVYERFSYAGGNRLSMSVTAASDGKENWVTAVTAGGSQGTFFKLNTWGEETFLDKFYEFLHEYKKRF